LQQSVGKLQLHAPPTFLTHDAAVHHRNKGERFVSTSGKDVEIPTGRTYSASRPLVGKGRAPILEKKRSKDEGERNGN